MTKKTKWNTAQWISFGNRVKNVRKEIQSMIMDLQNVCRAPVIDGLLSVERKLDNWKSKMEDLAAKDVPDAILTRVFYGDPLPENAPNTPQASPVPITTPNTQIHDNEAK